MPLFDYYVMVDWTGGNSRRANKKDAIWIAHGAGSAKEPDTLSPPSRKEATDAVRALLRPFAEASAVTRALVCFDFAYGFPRGFAKEIPAATSMAGAPGWQRLWMYLAREVKDDLAGRTGAPPSNKSNRFEVADGANREMSPEGGPFGPFFSADKAGRHVHVPQKRPKPLRTPFTTRAGTPIDALRLTDERAKSDTPFRLFGTGSVGSQALTGIARLADLRFGHALAAASVVWPFETGWATNGADWLPRTARIVHAEIYPSIRKPLADTIKDRGQVRAMWAWARERDAAGDLGKELGMPEGIAPGDATDRAIRDEEGWIVGVR
jgi:precorrin-8X/cobalt-precorrin-8 methylmutase